MRIAVVTAALLGASAYAASSAWVEDWTANRALIDASVKGVPDLEASASAFEAEIDAAIANGTSDTELTRLLMDFLVELDDDPRFGGFAATNESSASASGSVSAGSASAAGSSTGSSSSGASAVNAASVVTVAVAVVATVAMTLA